MHSASPDTGCKSCKTLVIGSKSSHRMQVLADGEHIVGQCRCCPTAQVLSWGQQVPQVQQVQQAQSALVTVMLLCRLAPYPPNALCSGISWPPDTDTPPAPPVSIKQHLYYVRGQSSGMAFWHRNIILSASRYYVHVHSGPRACGPTCNSTPPLGH